MGAGSELALALALGTLGVPPASLACKAEGEAPIIEKNRARARASAIEHALTSCALDAAGGLLASGEVGGFLGPEERARALGSVEPRLARDPARVFASHKVESDRAQKHRVRVRVTGELKVSVLIDVAREAIMTMERSAARVGVIGREAYHSGKNVDVSGQAIFAGQLGRLLHDRGYEVLAVPFDPATEAELLDDVSALAKRGRSAEVELIIAVELTITDGDPGSPLARTRPVVVDGRLQVVEAASGKLRGRVPIAGKITAGSLEKGLARIAAEGALDASYRSLGPMLRVEASRESPEARVVRLAFAGLSGFREGRAILELLKLIPGLSAIDERSYEDGKLEAEARWVGPLAELESLLREEMSKHRGLRELALRSRQEPDRIEWAR